jgi:hypothetical protein
MLEIDRDLPVWFEKVSGPEWIWYVKYLSANDTYAKANIHQGGPYVAKEVLKVVFPQFSRRADAEENPDLTLPTSVDSHDYDVRLRLVWYNSKRRGQKNGRDEARLTRWGSTEAPVVSQAATGALTIFAYHRGGSGDADALRVWLARGEDDHDRIVDRVGPILPGNGLVLTSSGVVLAGGRSVLDEPCRLTDSTMPVAWKTRFPAGEEIVERVVAGLLTARGDDADRRLTRRLSCEYEMFRSVEEHHVLPRIQRPFASVNAFVEYAHSVTNRRKSRAGKSLELQLVAIFKEEGLPHTHGAFTEGKRRPDFIFPSAESYWSASVPDEHLRMLAAKTTVKDRWRQILNEARRVERKHLITLQEGVSEEQLREMTEEGVVLVVPAPLQKHYPAKLRASLMTLAGFIAETRALPVG